MTDLAVTTYRHDGRSIVAAAGEIDAGTAGQLSRAAADALSRGGPVVLDLTEVGFMDCSGLWVLLNATRDARGRGSLLHIAASRPVQRTVDLAEAGHFLSLHPDVAAALAAA